MRGDLTQFRWLRNNETVDHGKGRNFTEQFRPSQIVPR